ncbi:MAG: hypothetical protein WA821_22060 [Anaerolineales bacterium]
MKRMDLIVSIFAGIVLGILGLTTGVTNNFLAPQPALASSPINVALSTVLTSQTRWQTVQGSAEFLWYGNDGKTQSYTNKFALSQPDKVYVDVIDNTGVGVSGMWISDGQNIYDVNKKTKTYAKSVFPNKMKDTSDLPTTLSQINTVGVRLHPLATMINAPVREYLFPSWFPQGHKGDTYTLTQETNFLGRKVWVMKLHTIYNDDVTAWVDQQTGIILKYNQWMNGKKFLEMTFTAFQVNGKISPAMFSAPQSYSDASQ